MNYTFLFSSSPYNLSIAIHTLILSVFIVPKLLFQKIPPPEKSAPPETFESLKKQSKEMNPFVLPEL